MFVRSPELLLEWFLHSKLTTVGRTLGRKGRPYNISYQLKTPLSGSSTRGWEDSGNNDGTTFGSRLKLHSTTAVVVVLHYGGFTPMRGRGHGEACQRPASLNRRT
jgi:hypothetical protein